MEKIFEEETCLTLFMLKHSFGCWVIFSDIFTNLMVIRLFIHKEPFRCYSLKLVYKLFKCSSLKLVLTHLFFCLSFIDDGVLYFDEKLVDAKYNYGPLSTTSSVIRGVVAFIAVTPGKLNVSPNFK